MLASYEKENLEKLSKEQLIYVIEQYEHLCSMISYTLIRESRWEFDQRDAIKQIREYMNDTISKTSLGDKHLCNYINMKQGKITIEQYRDIILGED